MKLLLLLTVVVGLAVAKPSMDKKLLKLITNLLEKEASSDGKSDSGSGGASGGAEATDTIFDTTLFEGLDMNPFRLFEGYVDFSKPLDTSELEGMDEGIIKSLDAVNDIANGIVDALENADPKQVGKLDKVFDLFEQEIFPLFENPDANFEYILGLVNLGILQGAIGGTVGAARDEPGVDFSLSTGKLVDEVLNKAFLAHLASMVSLDESWELLGAEVEGEGLRECDQLWKFLGEADKSLDGQKMVRALGRTMACIRGNMQVIRDRIGMKAVDFLPPEDRPSPLPLPRLIYAETLLQHIAGSAWWAGVNIEMTCLAIDKELGVDEKRTWSKVTEKLDNKFLKIKNHYNNKRK